ncbi:type I restriction-modification system subunit M [Salibacterium qingdaonense]|uniref:site-specific DNA-methyltransferase (adenine-specific) n=1 Tax=Salibacterium qingdaonense TaxID=266892 RepID=A0A1I4R0E9_9BACI|nr:class I SAM-dependent DNA methyltransferase [Salibacterium qingdaonense]SFM45436.1 type I restriction enzyme M protein [Salibacterium qingdaonense]
MAQLDNKASFLWSIADLLRGDYKQSDYGKVILPLTVLRRLDCVLKPSKEQVLEKVEQLQKMNIPKVDDVIEKTIGHQFFNTSPFDFETLKNDPENIALNLRNYINGFSENARQIIEHFHFDTHIDQLDDANVLYMIITRFSEVDLHPSTISNLEMGYIFEELIRKFSESSNETAGEHFTPREVIRLIVNVLYNEDDDALSTEGTIRTLYDPACGTGGMLSVAEQYLNKMNPDADLYVHGQELNEESYAICKSDMMLKGQDPSNIKFGNSFRNDGFSEKTFDNMLSNPPFGVEWKKVEKAIRDEHENLGHAGRFGAGLPRVNDGSLLFLQHMISKMKPEGSRLAIILNGSPLFTGGAESGESNIRRWIIENDWVEAIIGLPDQLFYNTGISTYIWVLSNKKKSERKGKIQLIDGTEYYQKMRKSLGEKRHELSEEHITAITNIYGDMEESEHSKIFSNEDFGFQRVTVERPLRLEFQITADRIPLLEDEKTFQNLAKPKKNSKNPEEEKAEGEKQQRAIRHALETISPSESTYDQQQFEQMLKNTLSESGVKLTAGLKKTLLQVFSVRKEEAPAVKDAKGNIQPDPELRDYENVPLTENIEDYMEREVLPHVPDAWVDEEKTKIGYAIPFTRYFYQYTPLRPTEEIEQDIHKLQNEILDLMKEVHL